MSDQRLMLRATLKLLASFAVLWLGYIFLIGLFGSNEPDAQKTYRFDISSIGENQASYFHIERRELLVIHHARQIYVYWADDPVYGCKLEYLGDSIKPVCTGITYSLDGRSTAGTELKTPEYDIRNGELLVF